MRRGGVWRYWPMTLAGRARPWRMTAAAQQVRAHAYTVHTVADVNVNVIPTAAAGDYNFCAGCDEQ